MYSGIEGLAVNGDREASEILKSERGLASAGNAPGRGTV
jgi:hypothetical protein